MAAGVAALVLIGGLSASTRYQPSAPVLRGQVRQVDVTGAPDPAALGAADTRFGLALLARLGDGNVVFSPSSIGTGLGMAYLGARRDTATAMAKTMCLPTTGDALVAGLHSRTTTLSTVPGMRVSDTVWTDPTVHTRQSYLDNVATAYDSGVRQVPLLTDPSGSADAINGAISNDTNGMIPRIVTPDQLSGTGWVLTDATYLKAPWANPFDPNDTAPGAFETPHGTVTAKYLNETARLGMSRAGGWTAVSLPYKGNRLEMVALMGPDTDPSAATLHALLTSLAPEQVTLSLPKVDLRYQQDLSGPLAAMGMGIAFSDRADLTGLSPEAGSIAFVQHSAALKVGERGTEAAAATAVGIEASAASPTRYEIRFDHPYLMLIRDRRTGEPLFLSRIVDPTEG